MKVATFTVRATLAQSARWKRAAEGEGFASVGSWAAGALDAYLEHRTRAGRPLALSWHYGTIYVNLDGQDVPIRGHISPPFGIYRGAMEGRLNAGCRRYSLVHLPTRRLVATLRSQRQCQALASELAPVLLRDEHAGGSVVERHIREQA
ncbi:MAG TPA: hypothetical protein VH394_28290 [Thermoanaerobaculia bacterium]|nr:hypothetical protein [Thermoanaerobaculia bacterium]